MLLAEILDEAVCFAMYIKNPDVAPVPDALATQLIAYRGDRPVAMVIFMESVPEAELLRTLALTAYGFDAETIVLMTEAYASPTEINPLTGLPWRRGEVEDVAHLESPEWATPTILVTAINRGGDICAATLPYSRQDGFRWMEQRLFQPEDADLAPDLKAAMTMPSFSMLMPGPEDERDVRDTWTVEHLEDLAPCNVELLGRSQRLSTALARKQQRTRHE